MLMRCFWIPACAGMTVVVAGTTRLAAMAGAAGMMGITGAMVSEWAVKSPASPLHVGGAGSAARRGAGL